MGDFFRTQPQDYWSVSVNAGDRWPTNVTGMQWIATVKLDTVTQSLVSPSNGLSVEQPNKVTSEVFILQHET